MGSLADAAHNPHVQSTLGQNGQRPASKCYASPPDLARIYCRQHAANGQKRPKNTERQSLQGIKRQCKMFLSIQCSKPPCQALNMHIMCRPERKSRTNLPCSGRGNSMKQHFRKDPYLYPIHQGLPLLSRLLYLHQQMLQLLLKRRHHLFSNDPSGIMPFSASLYAQWSSTQATVARQDLHEG